MTHAFTLAQIAFEKAANSVYTGKKRIIFERQGYYFLDRHFDFIEKRDELIAKNTSFAEVLDFYLMNA